VPLPPPGGLPWQDHPDQDSQRLLQLRASLQQAVSIGGQLRINLLLSFLLHFPMSPQQLFHSQLAAVVRPLAGHESPEVAHVAAFLMWRWKALLAEHMRELEGRARRGAGSPGRRRQQGQLREPGPAGREPKRGPLPGHRPAKDAAGGEAGAWEDGGGAAAGGGPWRSPPKRRRVGAGQPWDQAAAGAGGFGGGAAPGAALEQERVTGGQLRSGPPAPAFCLPPGTCLLGPDRCAARRAARAPSLKLQQAAGAAGPAEPRAVRWLLQGLRRSCSAPGPPSRPGTLPARRRGPAAPRAAAPASLPSAPRRWWSTAGSAGTTRTARLTCRRGPAPPACVRLVPCALVLGPLMERRPCI
jgi:hypothetical protein